MNVLFTFENPLPSAEADAEVFFTTARYLARRWNAALHLPVRLSEPLPEGLGLPLICAVAPAEPPALRHFACGATLVLRKAFRKADFIYTRNLWVAWMAVHCGGRVVFDHYRPWPDQIPPLQRWIYRLMNHPRFVVNICHSDYTASRYRALGIPQHKLVCIHNGFEPTRLEPRLSAEEAKTALGLPVDRKTVVYTGRINHKKGLQPVLEAARLLPALNFVLVGSYGEGPIEAQARDIPNVTIVPFQKGSALARYIFAADVLLIPPSLGPLQRFGSTVLPLKLFLYLAAGRPIVAGNTLDVREILKDGENALLCTPDDPADLAKVLKRVTEDDALASRLAACAQAQSLDLTWEARETRIDKLVRERLASPCNESGEWSAPQERRWRRMSVRWLLHVLTKRSVILPTHS